MTDIDQVQKLIEDQIEAAERLSRLTVELRSRYKHHNQQKQQQHQQLLSSEPPANRSAPDIESIVSTRADFRPAVITGLRVEETAEKEVFYEDGVSVFLAGTLFS
ncbi:hypothetical protein DAPPUDRAFT_328516 [Daphnia pulex]|uniref:Uncharacterized protein n=1 Tax=Daphnia pulex TaxID=6669 RepID=E9HDX7_DAPPU|nr:hypothetical protein DAPPUDRAFT_328516 [Daphnia pulex]|eukprot:EFX70055.1 hypothetical protein DAPPUDRAFT_328516 [Daphnia pulex]